MRRFEHDAFPYLILAAVPLCILAMLLLASH